MLSQAADAALRAGDNTLLLSVASVWEIVIKQRLQKFGAMDPIKDVVQGQVANGVRLLPITLDHVLAVGGLPLFHRDPFDRLLVAQSIVEDAILVTSDVKLTQYGVRTLW